MKASELVLIGLVVFVALVVTDLWMEQQRCLIAQALFVSLASPPKAISGFAGAA
jgi:hypothetical protein